MRTKRTVTVLFSASLLIMALLLNPSLTKADITYDVTISIDDDIGTYYPGQPIQGKVVITYGEYFDRNSVLKVCIDESYDDCKFSSNTVSLADYLYPPEEYAYAKQKVGYYLKSSGYHNWTINPVQEFDYKLKANGTCGQCGPGTCGGGDTPGQCPPTASCDCPSECRPLDNEKYPCVWEYETTATFSDTVDASEGLKFLIESTITPPPDNNQDTKWYMEILSNKENVTGTMRKACGSETYQGNTVEKTGWVNRKSDTAYLLCSTEACDQGLCSGDLCESSPAWQASGDARYTCIENFDPQSLTKTGGNAYKAYGGPTAGPPDYFGIYTNDGDFGGGIYASKDKNTWTYQVYGHDVIWNASDYLHCDGRGYIRIVTYDPTMYYKIVYLPPNGNRSCAYTNVTVNSSREWKDYEPDPNTLHGCSEGCLEYGDVYEDNFTKTQLSYLLKPCSEPNCLKTATGYSGYSSYPDFSLKTIYLPEEEKLNVEVRALRGYLESDNQTSVDFSEFEGLEAPGVGSHNMIVMIVNSSGAVIQNTTYELRVGSDWDQDGWTVERGDCNDSNPDTYPGAPEVCDLQDNDCDGMVDEDFGDAEAGIIAGDPCYDWPKSACAGIWICKPNGQGLMCSSGLEPGDQEEICLNDIDDDCDGVVDEETELVDGKEVSACTFRCRNGQTQACGSDIGECESGYRVCVNNEWSECIDSVGPSTETCNRKDDDCDGIIDNVNMGTSMEEAACACFDGNLPFKTETCNDIDDDCDGQIDENIICCQPGDERQCGTNVGLCKYGIQKCDNGRWGECTGGIQPVDEICYDKLDNNCNGQIDEYCDPEVTCFNKVKDLNEMGVDCGGDCQRACENYTPWIIFSIVISVIIVSAGVLEFTGKI